MHANADVLPWEPYAPASGALFFLVTTQQIRETSGIKFAKFIPHHLIVEEIENP
jgi:hypothetical protein